MRVTAPSSWPWIDHLVSGLRPATMRPIRTRFPYASPTRLSLLLNVVADPLYKRYAVTPFFKGSHCLYASGFRFYFTPLPGFFSPFPHGTGSLSVDDEYLALEDGPPIFKQDFSCPALLVACLVPTNLFVYGLSPTVARLPDCSTKV